MAAPGGRELPDTPTWAVAVVCMVLILISVAIEHALHKLTHVRYPILLIIVACSTHKLVSRCCCFCFARFLIASSRIDSCLSS